MINSYVIESKRLIWNRNGQKWIESVEQTIAYGESWEQVKRREEDAGNKS